MVWLSTSGIMGWKQTAAGTITRRIGQNPRASKKPMKNIRLSAATTTSVALARPLRSAIWAIAGVVTIRIQEVSAKTNPISAALNPRLFKNTGQNG